MTEPVKFRRLPRQNIENRYPCYIPDRTELAGIWFEFIVQGDPGYHRGYGIIVIVSAYSVSPENWPVTETFFPI